MNTPEGFFRASSLGECESYRMNQYHMIQDLREEVEALQEKNNELATENQGLQTRNQNQAEMIRNLQQLRDDLIETDSLRLCQVNRLKRKLRVVRYIAENADRE